MINWQLTKEFLYAERDRASPAFVLIVIGFEGEPFRNDAGGWMPHSMLVGFSDSSALPSVCSGLIAAAGSDLAVKIVFPFCCPMGLSVWLTSFPIFWAKYLGERPLVGARICNNLQPPCELCVEWHVLCKEVVSFIMLVSRPLLGHSRRGVLTSMLGNGDSQERNDFGCGWLTKKKKKKSDLTYRWILPSSKWWSWDRCNPLILPLMLSLHQTFPEPFFLSYLWGVWPILLNIFEADKYSFFVGGFDFWIKERVIGIESSSWGGWDQRILVPLEAT